MEYLAALHPACGRGSVSTLTVDHGRVSQRTWQSPELNAVAGALAEGEAYVALSRVVSPARRRPQSRCAQSHLWLDLDTYRVPALAALDREEIAALILCRIAAADLPPPALLIDSGRGYIV